MGTIKLPVIVNINNIDKSKKYKPLRK